jgi:hypothetical protein
MDCAVVGHKVATIFQAQPEFRVIFSPKVLTESSYFSPSNPNNDAFSTYNLCRYELFFTLEREFTGIFYLKFSCKAAIFHPQSD